MPIACHGKEGTLNTLRSSCDIVAETRHTSWKALESSPYPAQRVSLSSAAGSFGDFPTSPLEYRVTDTHLWRKMLIRMRSSRPERSQFTKTGNDRSTAARQPCRNQIAENQQAHAQQIEKTTRHRRSWARGLSLSRKGSGIAREPQRDKADQHDMQYSFA